jgi:anthranilate synthase component I
MGIAIDEGACRPGLEEFLAIAKESGFPVMTPVSLELPLPAASPPEIFSALCKGKGVLLESMEGGETLARYSYIGEKPGLTVTFANGVEAEGDPLLTAIARDPDGTNAVEQIGTILKRFRPKGFLSPGFFGGMVGYFAYDLVYDLFPVPAPLSAPQSPAAQFMLITDGIAIDRVDRRMTLFTCPFLTEETEPENAYDSSVRRLRGKAALISGIPLHNREDDRESKNAPVVADHSAVTSDRDDLPERASFEDAVSKAKEYIVAGDIFQAVLSRRIERPFGGDPFSLYRALRKINPSPYMYFLDFGDRAVVGASPEMLLCVRDNRISTVPIAGTRPRGCNEAEDARLAEELLKDPKERAEHIMLVDLARNDLGRVSQYGSVCVDRFMDVERFSHVQHLVSTVSGTLREGYDCTHAFASCFPAGTVSGAPKIRAMQLITELEARRRGIYAGATGYIGFSGELEFAITIRTIVIESGIASVQVGAGIVADSVPSREWEETGNKAAAMIRAIERVGGVP